MNPAGIFTSIYRVPQSMRPGPCLARSLLFIPVKRSLQRMVLYKQQASQGTPYVRVCLGNNIFYKLTLHAPAVTRSARQLDTMAMPLLLWHFQHQQDATGVPWPWRCNGSDPHMGSMPQLVPGFIHGVAKFTSRQVK
jgi:hypothetical protein